jgi:hypothetical protein
MTETKVQIFINLGQGGVVFLLVGSLLVNPLEQSSFVAGSIFSHFVYLCILCPIVECKTAEICPFDPKCSLLSCSGCFLPMLRRKLHLVTLLCFQESMELLWLNVKDSEQMTVNILFGVFSLEKQPPLRALVVQVSHIKFRLLLWSTLKSDKKLWGYHLLIRSSTEIDKPRRMLVTATHFKTVMLF